MPVTASVEWNGESVIKGIDELMNVAILDGAIVVQRSAVDNAPIITGNLRRSINIASNLVPGTFTDDDGKRTANIRPERNRGVVGSIVVYAASVEAAKPYLKPALTNNTDKIISIFKQTIKKSRYVK